MKTLKQIIVTFGLVLIYACSVPIAHWNWEPNPLRVGDAKLKVESVLTRGDRIVTGADIAFANNSDDSMLIEWNKSSISIGTYTTIPFLGGMKWVDAGNPNILPFTSVPPEKIVRKRVSFSEVSFDKESGYYIRGIRFSPGDNVSLILNLYIKKGSNPPTHYTFEMNLSMIMK